MWGSCANFPPLCECRRGGEGWNFIPDKEWMRQLHVSWACRCDRLITTQVPHTTTKREKSHKATLYDQTTVTVFGNFYEEKITVVKRGEVSVLLSVLPPVLPNPHHISARTTTSVRGKKLKFTKCLCWKKIHSNSQPSQPRLKWTFPQKTASLPGVKQCCLLMAVM